MQISLSRRLHDCEKWPFERLWLWMKCRCRKVTEMTSMSSTILDHRSSSATSTTLLPWRNLHRPGINRQTQRHTQTQTRRLTWTQMTEFKTHIVTLNGLNTNWYNSNVTVCNNSSNSISITNVFLYVSLSVWCLFCVCDHCVSVSPCAITSVNVHLF